MANEYSVNQSDLVSVANAIRTKGGTSETLVFPAGFVSAVQAIQAGGGISNNIVAGSFTLAESLTKASPLYIDVTFPKNKFPLMYCAYEDTSNLSYGDTSHTVTRLRYLIASKINHGHYNSYMVISSYNSANKYTMTYVDSNIIHKENNYANGGGICGSMDISLNDNQIRFTVLSDGVWYLGGRTYNYILYWGD